MPRIRILAEAVANRIAAGEVVERPASAVKELLENSLDAGATSVRMEVEAGGKRMIRVVDNGCGMMHDDAMLAFERHATSKLRTSDDLLAIATLGFRGEALPSIVSVSRLLRETGGIAGGNLGERGGPVLLRARAQEILEVGHHGAGTHRLAGYALRPGASGQTIHAQDSDAGNLERGARGNHGRARISIVGTAGA